jgi:hypothetical protein
MGISQDEVLELLRVKAWERAGEILGEDVDDGFDLVFPEERPEFAENIRDKDEILFGH